MSDLVRVESFDALKKFREALCKFAEIVGAGLDEAEFEVQRMGFWVRQDQQLYWNRQVIHRTELLTRAKLALKQKENQQTTLGGRYSCVDEIKAVTAAQRALEEARQKQANVQRWGRLLDEEAFSFQALTQGLRLAIQGEIPVALAQLDQMVAALAAYAVSAESQEQTSTATSSISEQTAGTTDLPAMARAAPVPPAVVPDVYHTLHARTPSQAIRDATQIVAAELGSADGPTGGRPPPAPGQANTSAGNADRTGHLAACGLAQTPCGPEEKLLLARGVLAAQQVYLERGSTHAPHDSGWYIGFVDDTEVAGYDAISVAQLIAARPEWAAALALPAGCLVVFDGPALAAVYDQRGQLAWLRDSQ